MTDSRLDRDFRRLAQARAIAWKSQTPTLPEAARVRAAYIREHQPEGTYDFCIPSRFAAYNLLPDVRTTTLDLFSEDAIRWHAATEHGPSNHLLDSQVQCVNALGPGMDDPLFVKAAFEDVLPIDEVLEIEPNRFLTFEYIGARDHLHEGHGGTRMRGSMTTSADAIIRYRTPRGDVEAALIEWKFIEDYRRKELAPVRGTPRRDRYRRLWDQASPLRKDVIPYDDLFVEPFYQLMRQQLLAYSMEQEGELGAKRVRVVHVCPGDNLGVREALNRPSHEAAGDDVIAIWSEICNGFDGFVSIDSDRFAAGDLRSSEYRHRYCTESTERSDKPSSDNSEEYPK